MSRDNPCAFSQYPSVLPYSRRIVDAASGQTLGYLVLLLREAVFVEVCGAFLTREDEAFCLADALGQPVVCSEGCKALAASGLAAGGGTFPEQQTLGGVPYRFFRHPAPSYPWQLVEAVPMHQFAQQREILQSAAGVAVILTLALSLLLATVFSGQLARPSSAWSRRWRILRRATLTGSSSTTAPMSCAAWKTGLKPCSET